MRKYLKKERKKRGKREKKKIAPFWKVMSFFFFGTFSINGWCIPIRRLAAAAAAAITGKQKRNRKDKIGKVLLRIKQMAVQHKVAIPVNCELTARRDGVQRLIVFFSIDIVNDVILSNHFIHSSASLATLRYAALKKNHRYRYSVPYPLPSLRVYNKKHHRLLARFIKTITPSPLPQQS